MNAREEIKILLMKKKVTLSFLAERMTERTGKKYYQSYLSHKINDESAFCNVKPFDKIKISIP